MCVIGKILSVHDRNNSLVLLLSDGTGELEVNHWLQEESEQVSLDELLLGLISSQCVPLGAHILGAGVVLPGPTVMSGQPLGSSLCVVGSLSKD
jgi:hypothetical protein